MRVHLGGHLSWYDLQKRSWVEVSQPEPVLLLDLAHRLGVPPAEIAIAAINGHLADLTTAVASGDDRVDFFPPMGGGDKPKTPTLTQILDEDRCRYCGLCVEVCKPGSLTYGNWPR